MINRDMWEGCVKDVRQEFLDKTSDPNFRRIAAGIMDAAFDELYDKLTQQEVFHDAVTLTVEQYDRANEKATKTAVDQMSFAPDWMISVINAFSSQLKCDLFYPEKEV